WLIIAINRDLADRAWSYVDAPRNRLPEWSDLDVIAGIDGLDGACVRANFAHVEKRGRSRIRGEADDMTGCAPATLHRAGRIGLNVAHFGFLSSALRTASTGTPEWVKLVLLIFIMSNVRYNI